MHVHVQARMFRPLQLYSSLVTSRGDLAAHWEMYDRESSCAFHLASAVSKAMTFETNSSPPLLSSDVRWCRSVFRRLAEGQQHMIGHLRMKRTLLKEIRKF